MKRIIFAAAFSLVAFASGASAQTIERADGLYSACKAGDNLNMCAMYLAGFTGGAYAQSVVDKGSVRYCLPSGTTHKQNLDTVLRYLDSNPQARGQPTAVAIYMALAQAHPCK
ncbi:hypothetical protein BTH42_33075 [Burkholderia sp. SRS-W-2-2016]|uniref:Rap1a/Tai family immunity protein n=1 Tax=Burkholderia sp. SRS-W-2-2016 TaxID=1926878 RepID=UPI00094B1E3F|nr:Rap1a/Tai family immunity protein [Burkholderia sp. SRS-W-2-2016]OLL27434.1 hypothetical protein BTH42_33075 [Burkholderia sp. SRS-W-2-2016]